MYKLTELMVSIRVVIRDIFCVREFTTTIHFAMNPAVGGIPAKFAIRTPDLMFTSISGLSLLFSLNWVFHIMCIVVSTEIQYKIIN